MFDFTTYVGAATSAMVLAIAALAWIIALVRMLGLRTLSKMTAFDFVVTLATGSLLASAATASGWLPYLRALTALTTLLIAQYLLARARRNAAVRRVIENEPLLLVYRGRFIEQAMHLSRVTHDDVIAKLRTASVSDMSAVAAVVLEATGDISVIKRDAPASAMLAGIRNPPSEKAPD